MNTASGSSGSVSAKPTRIWCRRKNQLIMTKQVLSGMRGTMHCSFLEAFPGGMKQPKPMRQCCNALVLLSVVGTELNHLLGYLHCSSKMGQVRPNTKPESFTAPTHRCAEGAKCSGHQLQMGQLILCSCGQLPDSWAQWTWPCSHKKEGQQCLFHTPQKTKVRVPLAEGLLQSQKGWKNAALLPGSPFHRYTMTRSTIKAIANLLLPGRWAKGPNSRLKSQAKQPNNVHRARQSRTRASTQEQKEKEKSKKVVSGVCLQVIHQRIYRLCCCNLPS